VTEILEDEGNGISNGLSVDMIFCRNEGAPLFHNAEVAPPINESCKESQLSVLTLSPGESLIHCNKYTQTNKRVSSSSERNAFCLGF
jgi:hypothetical protein